MKNLKTRMILIAITMIALIQFFKADREVPIVAASLDFVEMTKPTAEVVELLKTSCYDCHSYETKYPWYANVAPLSWWIDDHIGEAREELNFSIWGEYSLKRKLHKLEECEEMVEEGEMPLDSYTWIHGEARMSEDQREDFIKWIRSQRNRDYH